MSIFGETPNINRRDSVTIDNIIFISNEGCGNMYVRPYTTNFNGFDEQNRFKSAIEDFVGRGRSNDPSGLISREFSNTIKLKSSPGVLANIPNGWGEPRLRFFMLLSINYGHNMYRKRYLLQGYTDHIGVIESHGKYVFDPNMVFICNSVLGFTETITQTIDGRSMSKITSNETYNIMRDVGSAYQEITTNNFNRGINDEPLTSIRPTDIHTSLSIESERDNDERIEFFADNSGTVTSRSEIVSSRSNGDPLNFISKIVSSYKIGSIDASRSNTSFGATNVTGYQNASNVASRNEPRLSGNEFFKHMIASKNDITSTMFTVKELNMAFNGILNNMHINSGFITVLPVEQRIGIGDIENNISTDPEYIKCLELLQSAISNASSYGITEADIVFSITGSVSYDANIIRFDSPIFRSVDDNTYFMLLETFKDKFINVCLARYVGNDYDAYVEGQITINLLGESILQINYNPAMGNNHTNIRYVSVPSFADSLFNSCLGRQKDKNIIVNDLVHVLDLDINNIY